MDTFYIYKLKHEPFRNRRYVILQNSLPQQQSANEVIVVELTNLLMPNCKFSVIGMPRILSNQIFKKTEIQTSVIEILAHLDIFLRDKRQQEPLLCTSLAAHYITILQPITSIHIHHHMMRMDMIKEIKKYTGINIMAVLLEYMLVYEANYRYQNKKASIIQKHFKEAISNPYKELCKRRLLREYTALS